jgi:hypothetical protein
MRKRVRFSHAFLRGTKDYQNGISLRDNPFKSDLHKQADWDKGYLSAAKGRMIATQQGRTRHVNLIVDMRDPREVFKSVPNHKQKGPDGNYIPGEIDFEAENEREGGRNLEIINKAERKLRSGKHKGEKIIVDVVNNPPGKRYFPRAWK